MAKQLPSLRMFQILLFTHGNIQSIHMTVYEKKRQLLHMCSKESVSIDAAPFPDSAYPLVSFREVCMTYRFIGALISMLRSIRREARREIISGYFWARPTLLSLADVT